MQSQQQQHLGVCSMLRRKGTQTGSSLVELMVGIAVSLILLAGVLTVMMRVTIAGGDSIQATRLNQQVRSSLDFMIKDLQRAGYVDWYDAWDTDDDSTPTTTSALADSYPVGAPDGNINLKDYFTSAMPAIQLFGDVTLFSFPTPGTVGAPAPCNTNCDCILFSYDLNEDGAQGVGAGATAAGQNLANFELFGLRWNAGAIQMRTAGNPSACNTGTWQSITDSNVTITAATFGLTYASVTGTGNDSTMFPIAIDGTAGAMTTACTPVNANNSTVPDGNDSFCLKRRKVDINISAQLATDANVGITVRSDVKIKNDYLDSTP